MEPGLLGALLVAVGSVVALAATLYLRLKKSLSQVEDIVIRLKSSIPQVEESVYFYAIQSTSK